MNFKGKNLNTIIAVVAILIIGYVGYLYTTRDRSGDALLSSVSSGSTVAVDGDLLNALRQLRQIKLDTSIFSNPTWLSLNDFSKTITPQDSNRQNPFAPLDSSLVPVTSTTAGTSNP